MTVRWFPNRMRIGAQDGSSSLVMGRRTSSLLQLY